MEFGGGVTNNYISQSTNVNDGSTIKPGSGYYLYGNVKIKEFNKLYIKLGLQAVEKNYSVYRSDLLSQKSKNLYLILPIVLQADLLQFGKIKLLGDVGLNVGYWCSRVIEGYVPDAFSASYELLDGGEAINRLSLAKYTIIDDFLTSENRFELNAQIGLQLQYRHSDKISPVLGVIFHNGLSSRSANEFMVTKTFNHTLIISIGALIHLRK